MIAAPPGDRVDDAADELLDAALALGGADPPAKIFRHHDVGRLLRPERWNFHVALFEDNLAAFVRDDGRSLLPDDLVERVDARQREKPRELKPLQ